MITIGGAPMVPVASTSGRFDSIFDETIGATDFDAARNVARSVKRATSSAPEGRTVAASAATGAAVTVSQKKKQ
jgi:hypothetical protein